MYTDAGIMGNREIASIALNKSKASIWYQINSKREKHANTYTFKKER